MINKNLRDSLKTCPVCGSKLIEYDLGKLEKGSSLITIQLSCDDIKCNYSRKKQKLKLSNNKILYDFNTGEIKKI